MAQEIPSYQNGMRLPLRPQVNSSDWTRKSNLQFGDIHLGPKDVDFHWTTDSRNSLPVNDWQTQIMSHSCSDATIAGAGIDQRWTNNRREIGLVRRFFLKIRIEAYIDLQRRAYDSEGVATRFPVEALEAALSDRHWYTETAPRQARSRGARPLS